MAFDAMLLENGLDIGKDDRRLSSVSRLVAAEECEGGPKESSNPSDACTASHGVGFGRSSMWQKPHSLVKAMG